MTKLTQKRINFIEQLHEAFVIRKGHGAFAYISIKDAMTLFDKYLVSAETADLFINRFIRTI